MNLEDPNNNVEVRLQTAFRRIKKGIFQEDFVPHKFHPRDSDFEPKLLGPRIYIWEIAIELQQAPAWQNAPHNDLDESYELIITRDGNATIRASTYQGGLHGLHTMAQLFYAHSEFEGEVYTPYAPLHIKDSPRFEHRGLNLDIARNRISPKDVIRTLDAMSFNKLNRLHLHATDSQSWPLEIPALPNLAGKGAYHKDQIWTVSQLDKVQKHGRRFGIEVYLEVDLPGHTASIFHSYPGLITAYNEQPWPPFALEPPSGQLKLSSADVPRFLKKLFDDLLPRIAPYSSHFHVGADELNKKSYELEAGLESSSKDVIRPYLQSLFDDVFSHLARHNFTPVAWEDILLDWDLDLPQSTILQVWRPNTSLASIVEKGHKVLFGACSHWYLDSGYGGWYDPDPKNPNSSVVPPYADWCPPYKNWRQVLSYDPMADIAEKYHHLVLGGEVNLWSELTDSVTLDHMLWPRLAAAAEVLWRGKGEVSEGSTRRLAEMRERLVGRGIASGMVQMEWCLRNEGGCRL